MIKNFGLPAFAVMAAGAVSAKIGWVSIILEMAANTVGWGRLKVSQIPHSEMAVHALDIGMLAQQREAELVMVKLILREPIGPIMTGPAVRTELSHVGGDKRFLITAVAAFTLGWFKARQPFRVAVLARKRPAIRSCLMRSQTEAKPAVIDLLSGDLRQVTLWAAMLSVAIPAFRSLQHPVEAGWAT